ncbi:hypothetical protein CYMTET_16495 [Cymbomonas tetramitiformis]|uniref:Pseudouridine synthase RsuA/RluA-like domain-containing protein n=1 Tax=Cymbomonas tetramitiformis TaxID=36881 RepID=A0AAE0L836_9CHLO|nr:hypothetical protein CYMTET_16495 [Cymbomonas tetramitiformis]|eukprot:gene19671-23530_t
MLSAELRDLLAAEEAEDGGDHGFSLGFSRALREAQIQYLQSIGKVTSDHAEHLLGLDTFADSLRFDTLPARFSELGPASEGSSALKSKAKRRRKIQSFDPVQLATEVVVLNKPFDVRLDLPNHRSPLAVGGPGELCDQPYAGNPERKYPLEFTVADWFTYWSRRQGAAGTPPIEARNVEVAKDAEATKVSGSVNAVMTAVVADGKNPSLCTSAAAGDEVLKVRFCNQLDNATSGILVLGRTKRAAGLVASQFQDRRTVKLYDALVAGHVDVASLVCEPRGPGGVLYGVAAGDGSQEICVTVPIRDRAIGSFERIAAVPGDTAQDGKGGAAGDRGADFTRAQDARTAVRVVKQGYFRHDKSVKCTLVQVRIFTGRRHQIRVHLQHLGHPVLGDTVYGYAVERAATELKRPSHEFRMFLHACSLQLQDLGLMYESDSGFDYLVCAADC